ncbi:hypothetical protein SteCoe_25236 [Stentor coeruleus]|uniref:Uncharacterized protein n=1 Tax=Stentor coeruleus TaxID=5963 RepID=A0A1R2BFM9_9CILI|nr:hypothetical protein SteCoe_25236 [Stentor coeruleus]
MENFGHSLGNIYRGAYSLIATVPDISEYKTKGTLTPKEFEEAGDFLVHRCPTWSWQGCESRYRQNYLHPDKQYLIARGVPCYKRISKLSASIMNITEMDNYSSIPDDLKPKDDWQVADISIDPEQKYEMVDESIKEGCKECIFIDKHESQENPETIESIKDENAVPILERDGYLIVNAPDENTINCQINDSIQAIRRYNLTITYDYYYRTPRLWLEGYDENYYPLSIDKVFEDVNPDYINKTVTGEIHPCLGITQVSVHPCNHSEMMKFLLDICHTDPEDIQVNKCLILFLKFLSSIVPALNYDFTMSTEFKKYNN